MRALTVALLFAITLNAYGQIPGYVSTDGLVAWFPFDGGAQDYSVNSNNGVVGDVYLTSDRYGAVNSAYDFNGGNNDVIVINTSSSLSTLTNDFTISFWLYSYSNSMSHVVDRDVCGYSSDWGFQWGYNGQPVINFRTSSQNYSSSNLSLNTWHHIVGVRQNGNFSLYVNGQIEVTAFFNYTFTNTGLPIKIGDQACSHSQPNFNGKIDDIGMWNRALSINEIESVFDSNIEGCTDDTACNYDDLASADDGSCLELDECGVCGGVGLVDGECDCDGSVLDAIGVCGGSCTLDFNDNGLCDDYEFGCIDFTACNYNPYATEDDGSCDYSCCPGPGCCSEGLYWDWEMEQCFDINPTDTNLDGCTDLNDLMDILAAYGDCAVSEFTCGDPLEYQGYEYETVQIGEQCWFAENCRFLPAVSSVTANSLESPHAYVYDYTGSDVGEALTLENYNTHGALYNFVAVEQWELCPVGWSVPSDDQFIQLEISAGLNSEEASSTGLRGSQGSDFKSLIWGGTDVLGFGAIPAGYKNDVSNLQSFNQIHDACYWWTSSPSIIEASSQGTIEQTAMEHSLFSDEEGIAREVSNRRHGFSVRCIKD